MLGESRKRVDEKQSKLQPNSKSSITKLWLAARQRSNRGLLTLIGDALEKLSEGGDELVDSHALERGDYVLVVDSGAYSSGRSAASVNRRGKNITN